MYVLKYQYRMLEFEVIQIRNFQIKKHQKFSCGVDTLARPNIRTSEDTHPTLMVNLFFINPQEKKIKYCYLQDKRIFNQANRNR